MQRRDIAFGNEQRGPGYAVCEIQYTVDASDRETDEVLAVENFKEAQHRKKPSNFNEKVHQIFIVQRAVEERTWENVVDEPVRDLVSYCDKTDKPHGERDKADEAEEREVIVFLWFVHENHLLSEYFSISQNGGGKQHKAMQRTAPHGAERGVSGVEEELEELEETVDAMRKELIRLRWKAEALETAVAVLAGLAGAFLVTAVRLLLR